jgi:hypothetical protein
MIVSISSDAEADLAEGFWFYERQSPGLGEYFRSCLIADIDSLAYYGGIHLWRYPSNFDGLPSGAFETFSVLHLLQHEWRHRDCRGRA